MFWWIVGLLLIGFIIWVAFRPIPIRGFDSHPRPVSGYEEAITAVQQIQEEDNLAKSHNVCITKLFEHGHKTEHVFILLHGFTTCPEQFNELGKQYFDAGANVIIPRMPYHGLEDRLTDDLAKLKGEDLAVFGDRLIDIAHGLGNKVTVMGISGGGTLTTWLAQNRADVDYAYPIAAFFGLAFIPASLTKFFARFIYTLPNFFMWWDPRTKADNPYSIYYAYPRYPMRGIVELMRLGMATQAQAEKYPAKAGSITMVLNDAEPGVSNGDLVRLLETWRKQGKQNLFEYHFEKEMKLPHDIITPGTPGVPVEQIFPRLMSMVKEKSAF
jgi:pimeloyl-ACP methyl ester carboxylesterase